MKKILAAIALVALSTTASAWGPREQGALAGIGGVLLFQHITQPHYNYGPAVVQSGYPQVWIPMTPQLTQPRVYNLGYAPPFPGARPLYQESWQFEPTCQCQVKVYNQIGWQ